MTFLVCITFLNMFFRPLLYLISYNLSVTLKPFFGYSFFRKFLWLDVFCRDVGLLLAFYVFGMIGT